MSRRPIKGLESGSKLLAQSAQNTGATNVVPTSRLPFSVSDLPQAKYSYSEHVFRNQQAIFAQENPMEVKGLYNQDKNIFWSGFIDYALTHPKILSTGYQFFAADENAWIFKFFPIKFEKGAYFMATNITIDNETPGSQTRKVPGREISFRVSSEAKSAEYFIQGFSMDYHRLKLPEGMEEWDNFSRALMSNMWATMIYMALMEFHNKASFYREPSQLFPYTNVPTTMNDYFKAERLTTGIFNKEPQAVHLLSAYMGHIFEQNKGLTMKGWIASRGDGYFSKLMDQSQLFYDKSGNQALANRNDGDNMTTFGDNLPVFTVPLLSSKPQGGIDHNLLEAQRQFGGAFHFYENTLHLKRGKYVSGHRSQENCSWTTNDKDHYKFDDFLRHCVEFIPIKNEYECNPDWMHDNKEEMNDVHYGSINRVLLNDMAFQASPANSDPSTNPFLRTETVRAGNERGLNVFLKYEGSGTYNREQAEEAASNYSRRDQILLWRPINVVGEMDEYFCKTRYLGNVYKTMEYAITQGLTGKERLQFKAGMELSENLSKTNPSKGAIDLLNEFSSKRMEFSAEYNVHYAIPNKWGGMDIVENVLLDDVETNLKRLAENRVWEAMSDICGFMTLHELMTKRPEFVKLCGRAGKIIHEFVPVYLKVIANMIRVSTVSNNACLSPKLIPFFNNNPTEMDDATRSAIVAWKMVFSTFEDPVVMSTGDFKGIEELGGGGGGNEGLAKAFTKKVSNAGKGPEDREYVTTAEDIGVSSEELEALMNDKRFKLENIGKEELQGIYTMLQIVQTTELYQYKNLLEKGLANDDFRAGLVKKLSGISHDIFKVDPELEDQDAGNLLLPVKYL